VLHFQILTTHHRQVLPTHHSKCYQLQQDYGHSCQTLWFVSSNCTYRNAAGVAISATQPGVLTSCICYVPQSTVGLVKSTSVQISIIESKQKARATSRSSADWTNPLRSIQTLRSHSHFEFRSKISYLVPRYVCLTVYVSMVIICNTCFDVKTTLNPSHTVCLCVWCDCS
jgi:hypothetical protein